MKIGIELNHRSRCLYDIDFIIKKLNNYYNCEIFNKNLINEYDLIICNNLNGGLFKNFLINKSLDQILLILPTSFDFDYFDSKLIFKLVKDKKEQKIINKNIYSGITDHNNVIKVSRKGSYYFKNRFIFPLIKFDFNNIKSRECFYSKYNINPELKIITFFDHRFVRGWITKSEDKKKYMRVKLNQKIIRNFKSIHDSFLKIGYKIIIKLYDFKIQELKKLGCYDYYKDLFYYDNKEDPRLIYKYSSFFMIASPSSVMHVPYLFDKKILFIVDN